MNSLQNFKKQKVHGKALGKQHGIYTRIYLKVSSKVHDVNVMLVIKALHNVINKVLVHIDKHPLTMKMHPMKVLFNIINKVHIHTNALHLTIVMHHMKIRFTLGGRVVGGYIPNTPLIPSC
jgi:hypothetical protein